VVRVRVVADHLWSHCREQAERKGQEARMKSLAIKSIIPESAGSSRLGWTTWLTHESGNEETMTRRASRCWIPSLETREEKKGSGGDLGRELGSVERVRDKVGEGWSRSGRIRACWDVGTGEEMGDLMVQRIVYGEAEDGEDREAG
jgi:hypothetical protein